MADGDIVLRNPGGSAGDIALADAGFTGAAATEVPAPRASAAGVLVFAGLAAVRLATPEASASGALAIAGSAAPRLPTIEANAAGTQAIVGSAAAGLPAPRASATVVAGLAGTAAVTLPGLRATSAGALSIAGTASAILPVVRAAAAAASGWFGVVVVDLPTLRASATAETSGAVLNVPGEIVLPRTVTALFTIDLPRTLEPLDTIELPSEIMPRKLHIGDIARAHRIRFFHDGDLTDPTTLRFEIFPKNADMFELEYGVAPDEEGGDAVIRESEGVYSLHFLITEERGIGRYRYNAIATGDVTAAEPSLDFDVHPLHSEED